MSEQSEKVGSRERRGDTPSRECPNCASPDVSGTTVEQAFQYGAAPNTVELTATVRLYRCGACGFEFTDESAERARHDAVCRHLGVLTPREIAAIRVRYDLSRAQFAELTRLGEATIARWERGALIQNGAYDQFLHLLSFPENIECLRERSRNVPPRSSAVRFRCLTLTTALRAEQERFELRLTGT